MRRFRQSLATAYLAVYLHNYNDLGLINTRHSTISFLRRVISFTLISSSRHLGHYWRHAASATRRPVGAMPFRCRLLAEDLQFRGRRDAAGLTHLHTDEIDQPFVDEKLASRGLIEEFASGERNALRAQSTNPFAVFERIRVSAPRLDISAIRIQRACFRSVLRQAAPTLNPRI